MKFQIFPIILGLLVAQVLYAETPTCTYPSDIDMYSNAKDLKKACAEKVKNKTKTGIIIGIAYDNQFFCIDGLKDGIYTKEDILNKIEKQNSLYGSGLYTLYNFSATDVRVSEKNDCSSLKTFGSPSVVEKLKKPVNGPLFRNENDPEKCLDATTDAFFMIGKDKSAACDKNFAAATNAVKTGVTNGRPDPKISNQTGVKSLPDCSTPTGTGGGQCGKILITVPKKISVPKTQPLQ